ncbi:hypothetical protein HYT23_02810 [Candidatus Pacearchaeota archaeon]|nr:hypothetical protein [Candidatus Pacearchaeota archaeon]
MPTCYNCNREIIKKDDANVLAFLGFVPRTFCNNCYSSKERGFARHMFYFPQQPINSKMYLFGLWVFTLIFVPLILFMVFSTILNKSSLAGLLIVVFILLLFLAWQWILYFKAKKILSILK